MERLVRKVLPTLVAACLVWSVLPLGMTAAQDVPDSSTPAATEAASATLNVTVVDATNGLPLPDAVVRVGEATALSSTDGLATLAVDSGWFEIVASAEGFQDLTLTLQMAEQGTLLERTLVMAPQLATGERADAAEERVESFLDEMGAEWTVLGDETADDLGTALTSVVPPAETIKLVTNGVYSGGFSTNGPPVVVTLEMDEYLKGVVPREMSNLWPIEALKAQAIAARCYATTHIDRHASIGGDVCNTVHCQAWSPAHYSQTDDAVDATSGEVARYDDAIISAFYFGHCDGNTRNSEDVWVQALPYCRGVDCECGYTYMYGHGVGMCQRGAQAMAERGATYVEILAHYYTGVTVGAGNPRVWGADRYSTSVETARLAFDPAEDGSWPGVTHVVIASGEDRAAADPLAAAGLTWAHDAPVFLVNQSFVPHSVKTAISQIAGNGQPITVHVVGGTFTIPDERLDEIETAASPMAVTFDRIKEGGDRFDMAAAIAERVGEEWESRNGAGTSPGVVLLANGADPTKFFDALALSPISADEGYPILLVAADEVPSATSASLGGEFASAERIVGGGPATVSEAVVSQVGGTRVWGPDRYQNSIAAADYAVSRGWLARTKVGVAAKLPDALCAGASMGRLGGVSLVTQGDELTWSVRAWMSMHCAVIDDCYIFGGPASVEGAVDADISQALAGCDS
jgi:hypothetical protein